MATLYDVAKLAGVSPKTVSRVFNESHLVTKETQKLVHAAVKELDYHPNAIAASLKRRRCNVIGFVVPYGSDFVFQDVNMMEQLRGAHDILTREGYEILISAPIRKEDALNEISRLVKHHNVDGVILYPSAGVDEIIAEFDDKKFFYVTLGMCFPGQQTNFVDISLTQSAYQATKYLIDTGHRQLGLLNRPDSFFMNTRNDLLEGYQTALQEAGIDFQTNLVYEGDYTFESGYQALLTLREACPTIDGLLCASDPMLYGVIKAMQNLGLTLGKELELISVDNLPLTQKLYPGLKAIHNPAYEQGSAAGKMIIEVLKTEAPILGVTLKSNYISHQK